MYIYILRDFTSKTYGFVCLPSTSFWCNSWIDEVDVNGYNRHDIKLYKTLRQKLNMCPVRVFIRDFLYRRRTLLSVSPSPYFVNISETAWTISIVICMQLLFRMSRDDSKFRPCPKTILKGFFEGIGGHAQSWNFHYFCLWLDFSEIWNNVSCDSCAAIPLGWNQIIGRKGPLFILLGGSQFS